MLLRGWEQNIEDIYYELFKRMRPFDKHFSDEKAKFCYEVLVKLLDTNPDYNNYFKVRITILVQSVYTIQYSNYPYQNLLLIFSRFNPFFLILENSKQIQVNF